MNQEQQLQAIRERIDADTEAILVGHTLGDLGQFLAGKLAEAELTPAPRPIEVSLAAVETAQEYPLEFFQRVNKRTHGEIADA